jgi:hypothetical protein
MPIPAPNTIEPAATVPRIAAQISIIPPKSSIKVFLFYYFRQLQQNTLFVASVYNDENLIFGIFIVAVIYPPYIQY